eukprot:6212334-Pleurochrysis_carterae.AAC.2
MLRSFTRPAVDIALKARSSAPSLLARASADKSTRKRASTCTGVRARATDPQAEARTHAQSESDLHTNARNLSLASCDMLNARTRTRAVTRGAHPTASLQTSTRPSRPSTSARSARARDRPTAKER